MQAKLEWNPVEQPFANLSSQKCDQMILQAKWRNVTVKNPKTQKTYTDFGVCCRFAPLIAIGGNL